eukprot:scaffold7052_cov254-Pinguiococcus_pyrenoidosus.AAC.49
MLVRVHFEQRQADCQESLAVPVQASKLREGRKEFDARPGLRKWNGERPCSALEGVLRVKQQDGVGVAAEQSRRARVLLEKILEQRHGVVAHRWANLGCRLAHEERPSQVRQGHRKALSAGMLQKVLMPEDLIQQLACAGHVACLQAFLHLCIEEVVPPHDVGARSPLPRGSGAKQADPVSHHDVRWHQSGVPSDGVDNVLQLKVGRQGPHDRKASRELLLLHEEVLQAAEAVAQKPVCRLGQTRRRSRGSSRLELEMLRTHPPPNSLKLSPGELYRLLRGMIFFADELPIEHRFADNVDDGCRETIADALLLHRVRPTKKLELLDSETQRLCRILEIAKRDSSTDLPSKRELLQLLQYPHVLVGVLRIFGLNLDALMERLPIPLVIPGFLGKAKHSLPEVHVLLLQRGGRVDELERLLHVRGFLVLSAVGRVASPLLVDICQGDVRVWMPRRLLDDLAELLHRLRAAPLNVVRKGVVEDPLNMRQQLRVRRLAAPLRPFPGGRLPRALS